MFGLETWRFQTKNFKSSFSADGEIIKQIKGTNQELAEIKELLKQQVIQIPNQMGSSIISLSMSLQILRVNSHPITIFI